MFESAAPADAAVSLDNSPELAMPALHRAAIGPIGSDYYLPIFSRFEAASQAGLSWNWSACLYHLNWLIFRGLWGVALAFALAMAGIIGLLLSLNQWVFDWPPELLYSLMAASLSMGLLAAGAWGNALFFNHSRKAMMAAIEANPTLVLACEQLQRQASSRGRFIRILVANGLLLAAAALAYGLLPGVGLPSDTMAPETLPVAAVAAAPAATTSMAASAATEAASMTVAVAASQASAAASDSTPSTVAAAVTPLAAPASSAASAASAAVVTGSEPASSPAAAASAAVALVTSVPEPVQSAVSAARASRAAHAAWKSASAAPAASSPASLAASSAATLAAPSAATPDRLAVATPSPVPPGREPAARAPAKGFFVNAGLFAQADNARNTLAKLQAAGLPAFTQTLQTSQGPRTRVRVGPFAKRTQAEAAIRKIHGMKLDAALVKP